MNLNNSNMSTSERVRYLPEAILTAYPFICDWAESDIKLETVINIQVHISEADNFPEEDFLEPIMIMVRGLMPKSGSKLSDFKELLDRLKTLQLYTNNASDCAREELSKADELLEKLGGK